MSFFKQVRNRLEPDWQLWLTPYGIYILKEKDRRLYLLEDEAVPSISITRIDKYIAAQLFDGKSVLNTVIVTKSAKIW